MLSIIHAHVGLLYTMWIVLIATAVTIVAKLATHFHGTANWDEIGETVTRPMLTSILPLLILSWLTAIDPTGVLIRIWYYVAAAVIVIRALITLFGYLKR